MKDILLKVCRAVKPFLLGLLYWILAVIFFNLSGGTEINCLIGGGCFLGASFVEIIHQGCKHVLGVEC